MLSRRAPSRSDRDAEHNSNVSGDVSVGAPDRRLLRVGTDGGDVRLVAVGAIGLGLGPVLVARRPWGTTG